MRSTFIESRRSLHVLCGFVLSAIGLLLTMQAAEAGEIKAEKHFRAGTVTEATFAAIRAQHAGELVTTHTDLELLWKTCKQPTEKLPEVDFMNYFLMIVRRDPANPNLGPDYVKQIAYEVNAEGVITGPKLATKLMGFRPSNNRVIDLLMFSRKGITGVEYRKSFPSPEKMFAPLY